MVNLRVPVAQQLVSSSGCSWCDWSARPNWNPRRHCIPHTTPISNRQVTVSHLAGTSRPTRSSWFSRTQGRQGRHWSPRTGWPPWTPWTKGRRWCGWRSRPNRTTRTTSQFLVACSCFSLREPCNAREQQVTPEPMAFQESPDLQ